jgi:hypothetical protein
VGGMGIIGTRRWERVRAGHDAVRISLVRAENCGMTEGKPGKKKKQA